MSIERLKHVVEASAFLSRFEKIVGAIKPGRNNLFGKYPVNIPDQSPDEGGLFMSAVDRDAAKDAVRELKAKGFKVSWDGNKDFTVTESVNEDLIDAVRPGMRVTIRTPQGQERSGKAVMRSDDGGWVLNMGGAHGTPGIANSNNIVKVSGAGSFNAIQRY